MKDKTTTSKSERYWPTAAVILLVVLGTLFFRSFLPGYVHFSNDGPLGQQHVSWLKFPQAMTGMWADLNYLGNNSGFAPPTVSALLHFLSAVNYSKFVVPIALFILGFGAWVFFNQLRLSPAAALIGGLIVALNSAFFSTACWGVPSQQIAAGFNFLALALVVGTSPAMPPLVRWARILLAGMAVGVNIMEGADIGALYSIFIAMFVCYHAWVAMGDSAVTKLSTGVGRVVLIALFAALISAQAVTSLIGTSIKGVAGTAQDTQTKEAHWDFATQWSFPKRETLALVIPGLYGFRMDEPEGGNYWGVSGRDPSWWRYFENKLEPGDSVIVDFQNVPQPVTVKVQPDGNITLPGMSAIKAAALTRSELQQKISEAHPASVEGGQGFLRQSGGGCYMGVTVVLLAFWAAFQSFRKNPDQGAADILSAEQARPSSSADRMSAARFSVFSPVHRKLIWFFVVAIVVSLPLAYGRYAPFFQFVYALPYASTVRNPGKFLALFTFSMTVLAAFGVHGLCRAYLETPFAGASDWGTRLKNWWAKASVFDRRWTIGCLATIFLSLVGWLIYFRSQSSLEQYLQSVSFDETLAPKIAEFSIRQVGWFVLFLSLGVGLLTLIVSGAFGGKRAKTGAILLGLLIVVDLGRADLPWIKYINYAEKYSDNPVLQKLRDQPYEHRVAILPFRAPPEYNLFDQIYRIEWAQHHFPYYDIQSLDIIQMPRMPADLMAWETALANSTNSAAFYHRRRWELTNTRYLLGAAGFLDVLNQQLDPGKQRFRIATTFDIVPKPGITMPMRSEEMTAALNPNGAGKYAVFDFTGALPRAKLYSNWQVQTNDQATLKLLGSESFDPAQTVLVAGNLPVTTNNAATNNAGSVEFESYSPKRITFKTQSDAASLLLLNDKYDPTWQVWVDGKQAELLRCNYLMRGVYLPSKGPHQIEFIFKSDLRMLYVSGSAVVLGIILLGVVGFYEKSKPRGV